MLVTSASLSCTERAARVELLAEELDGEGYERNDDKTENRQFPLEVDHGSKGPDEDCPFLHHLDEVIDDGCLESGNIVVRLLMISPVLLRS